MPDIPDFAAQAERVNFLREEAESLLVRWKKGQNFFASFFAELEALRPQITDQLLGEWCFWNLGIGLNTIHKTAQILGEADADRVRAMTKIARDIEKAKAAAQRKAAAIERAAKQAAEEAARQQREIEAQHQRDSLAPKRKKDSKTTSAIPALRAEIRRRLLANVAVRRSELAKNFLVGEHAVQLAIVFEEGRLAAEREP